MTAWLRATLGLTRCSCGRWLRGAPVEACWARHGGLR
jgi:hypothetical protein